MSRSTWAARSAGAEGRAGEALTLLRQMPFKDVSPVPWLSRGNAHLALGQKAQARYALAAATNLGASQTAAGAARSALLTASLAVTDGRREDAVKALEAALRPFATMVPYDIVRRQIELPGILVPRLAMEEQTEDHVAAYRMLSELYRSLSRNADAVWAEERADALAVILAGDQ